MKRSYVGIILLCIVLFLNVVCTQKAVNAYYYDHFRAVLVYAALNMVLFPVAIWIYRRERDVK